MLICSPGNTFLPYLWTDLFSGVPVKSESDRGILQMLSGSLYRIRSALWQASNYFSGVFHGFEKQLHARHSVTAFNGVCQRWRNTLIPYSTF